MRKAEKDLYERAAKKWGKNLQIMMAIEEMAELTKELVKYFRKKSNPVAIAEEVADVEITLNQLKLIVCDPDVVTNIKEKKLERLEKMLDG